MELLLSIVWLCAITLLILRAVRQRGLLRDAGLVALNPDFFAPLTVIIPARNEAENISRCLSSLTKQTYPSSLFQIEVVDDNSTDGTAEIVAKAALRHSGRINLFRARPLPPGWTGKSHACWTAASAVQAGVEWLCFVDADIEAEPHLLSAAIAIAAKEKIDFLSLAPKQDLVSFAERLVMPCGLYLLAFCQNLERVNGPGSGEVAATGQFILIKRAVYEAVGGHLAVSKEICEDVALARRVKQFGGRVLLYGGGKLFRTRMYTGWRTLWPGVSKNLVEMMGGPASTILTVLLGLALAWAAPLLPLYDALNCADSANACIALAAAVPASAAAFGLHIAGAAYFQIPYWYGFLFPLGYTAGAAMALDSVRRRLTGRIVWKGRTYP